MNDNAPDGTGRQFLPLAPQVATFFAIATRRSYAELISYLTPPIENAELYRGLAALKETIAAYRQTTDEGERQSLYQSIEECSRELNLNPAGQTVSL